MDETHEYLNYEDCNINDIILNDSPEPICARSHSSSEIFEVEQNMETSIPLEPSTPDSAPFDAMFSPPVNFKSVINFIDENF